ncbi:MAG: DUF4037 domain-containing protein [Eubacteriales bacterium]|nr:DUF4037 domain-containing protein [Eubacteriales bacterium]
MKPLQSSFDALLQTLKQMDSVRAIGKTGGEALPADGYTDIDLFVFCDQIPSQSARISCLQAVADLITITEFGTEEHPHWGLVDSILIGEQEVYLMYFTQSTFSASIYAILRGERTEREQNYFYPTGRLASIQGMHVFYDPDGYLADLKMLLFVYPDSLQKAILSRCLPKIDDKEDFLRAIRRKDVLFFHATLDLAIDYFLQTLFALNRVYFPSRKRSLEFIRGFAIKPEDCEARLEQVVALGACWDTLEESYQVWQSLCSDLEHLSL